MSKVLLLLLAFFLLRASRQSVAFAQDWTTCGEVVNTVGNVPELKCFEVVVYKITRAVLALAGVGAFLYLLFGGFRWLTSGGDPKALGDAQKTVSYAIIGLVLTVMVYAFLRVLSATFFGGGANLLRFELPSP